MTRRPLGFRSCDECGLVQVPYWSSTALALCKQCTKATLDHEGESLTAFRRRVISGRTD